MRKRLAHLALSDDGFLFDTVTGNTFTLNSCATLILRKLIEGWDNARIAEEVCRVYDTDEESAVRDLNQLVQYLIDLEILSAG